MENPKNIRILAIKANGTKYLRLGTKNVSTNGKVRRAMYSLSSKNQKCRSSKYFMLLATKITYTQRTPK